MYRALLRGWGEVGLISNASTSLSTVSQVERRVVAIFLHTQRPQFLVDIV